MCGVSVIVLNIIPVGEDSLCRAVASLRHEDLDCQSLWFSLDRYVTLGHARIDIIGLRYSVHALENRDESILIATKGELYETERVRMDLERAIHCVCTRSDSEIGLHLFEDVSEMV